MAKRVALLLAAFLPEKGRVSPVKLRVVHANGTIETLSLHSGAWTITPGNRLDRLSDGKAEYFFTKEGYYDGWGGAVNATPAEAAEIIDAMEEKRVVSAD